MDKATILAAITEAEEQPETNILKLKAKGDAIGRNRLAIKDRLNQIKVLETEIKGLKGTEEMLKIDLTELKVKEGNIIGTKAAFKLRLNEAQ